MVYLIAYPPKPNSRGLSTLDNPDIDSRISSSISPSTLQIFGTVLLGFGCLYSALSLLAAGAFALQGSEADAIGELLAIVFMIPNAVASNIFLVVSVASQAMTTIAVGEPCALSIPSICGQALVFLGLGIAWIFRTNFVLGPMKISITDLFFLVSTYLAFWWPFMDYIAVAAGQLMILLIVYSLRMNSKLAAGEGSLGNVGVLNEEETPLLLSR